MTQLASPSMGEGFRSWKHPDELFYPQDPAPTEEPPRYQNMASLYPDWHVEAKCVGQSEAIFFGSPEPAVRPQFTLSEIKRAQSICHTCPVLRQCMTAALENREEFGVWAGTTSSERQEMQRRIRSGRSSIDIEVDQYATKITIRTEGAA